MEKTAFPPSGKNLPALVQYTYRLLAASKMMTYILTIPSAGDNQKLQFPASVASPKKYLQFFG